MEQWLIDSSKIIIPGIFVAIVTSMITVRLSIRRFYEEKWWERKFDVYSKLFKALHHLKNYALEHLETYHTHQDIPEDKRAELEHDWKTFSREFDELFDLAPFQLNAKSVSILKEYEKKKNEARNHEDIYKWIDTDAQAAIDCIKQLSNEAKNDLKVK
ncbi:MAG: hypothetical protein KBT72_15840 [Zhongshania sp.]|nr:hypothetical protein [Zhongshania sp.]